MCVLPAHVRLHRLRARVEIDGPACQRNSADDFDTGKTHEAEIAAGAQVPVGREELLELGSADRKFTDGPDCEIRLEQRHDTS